MSRFQAFVTLFIIAFNFFFLGVSTKPSILEDIENWVFDKKCIPDLGCFSNGPPYFSLSQRPISLLPQDRNDVGVVFHLYTPLSRKVETNITNLNVSRKTVLDAGYQPTLRTIFIVSGFMGRLAPSWKVPMKEALFEVEDCNVILVDWSKGDGPWYEQAVANTRVVGAEIALLVTFLQINFKVNTEDIYIIGHSLGAHIAGYAGKRIPNLGRITGLDPAGPYFEGVDPSIRLNASDALFVDVIHTNAATNRFSGFGTTESIGHMDFYVNGGSKQPGCPELGYAVLDFLKHPGLDGQAVFEIMCDHHRAILLMTASIRSQFCHLMAMPCDSWKNFTDRLCGTCESTSELTRNSGCIEVGYRAEHYYKKNSKHLDLYVETTDKTPYCIE